MAETKLSAKTLHKSWVRWFFWHGSSQQAENMLGNAMGHALAPSISELYADNKEERIAAYKRSITLFNTEQQVGAICPGIVIGMEEARAKDESVTPEVIQAVKVALIGPTSAIGDSMWVATIIPILLTICMAITNSAGNLSWLGPLLYIICYPIGTAILSWNLWKLGYKTGVDGVYKFMSSGKLELITKAMSVLGLVVVGGLTASFVSVTLPIVITPSGGEAAVMDLNALINNIFPGLLPLGLTLVIWLLYQRKKWSPLAIMGLVFGLAIVLTVVGYIFGVYA
jgi:PTS system mannose-specific IID component